jgi:hypothetical protein
MGKKSKDWEKLSEQEKMSRTIEASGRKYPALVYLKLAAKGLPHLMDRQTGKPHDHLTAIKKFYLKKGVSGVIEYTNACHELLEEGIKANMEELEKLRKEKDGQGE